MIVSSTHYSIPPIKPFGGKFCFISKSFIKKFSMSMKVRNFVK